MVFSLIIPVAALDHNIIYHDEGFWDIILKFLTSYLWIPLVESAILPTMNYLANIAPVGMAVSAVVHLFTDQDKQQSLSWM